MTLKKCEPMCAPTNHTDEKVRCDVKHNSCKWSRIYCCNETMCNSDEGKQLNSHTSDTGNNKLLRNEKEIF